jgi:hypothetical protein
MPNQCTKEHKQTCIEILKHLLQLCCEEKETSVQEIITGDETWLHHSEPDVEVWSGNTSSPRTKKFRNMPSASKVMLVLASSFMLLSCWAYFDPEVGGDMFLQNVS